MKPIILGEKEKVELFEKFKNLFLKNLDDYTFNNGKEITFKASVSEKAKTKVVIMYTPLAYLRMQKLVDYFDSEVSWFGLVDQIDDKFYRVYDVLLCKQQVSGAKVDTKDEDMLEFITNLTDEQSDHMRFQAHSHVNFGTTASGTDLQNQSDILSSIPSRDGFYIFQIWNKKGDINTYLYDLTNNLFYDRDDIEITIEDTEHGTIDDFIEKAEELVEVKKYYPVTGYQNGYQGNYNYSNGYQGSYQTEYKKETDEKKEEKYYYPGSWPDIKRRYLYGYPNYDDYKEEDY